MSYTDDYADSGRYSRADQQRRLAQLLASQGSSMEPIASGWQGAARLAQALAGVLGNRAADKQDAAQQQALVQQIAGGLGMLGGGGGAAAPDSGPATTGSIGGGGGGGGIGSDYAASMTPEEAIVRTVAGEAAGEPAEGQAAVASVILNRAKQSGQSPQQVVLAKNQFEPWSRNPQQLMALTRGSPKYQQILANIQSAMQGQDVTGGATHFYAPRAQAALGRNTPAWARGPYQDIGNHRFFKLAGGPTEQTAALPGVVPVGSAPTPDVAGFLGQGTQANPPSLADRQALIRQVLTGAKESPADVAAEVRRYYATPQQSPLTGAALPGVAPMAAAPSPGVMNFLGGGGQQAQPAGMQIGDGAFPESPQAPKMNRRPPDYYLRPPPVPAAETAPSPLDERMNAGGGATAPVDPRIIATAQAAATTLPFNTAGDPRQPKPRPEPPPAPDVPAPAPPIQPPAAPVARNPAPRPAPAVASPVVQPAVGPATTAAIPRQRGQIFREPAMSAQEFARQGQNYLTGRPSFANQQRVAPRTMQEPVVGMAGGAPAGLPAAAPASPRQSLIQRLFGGGGGGGAAAPQGAPAGSAVAGAGWPAGIDPQRMALAQVLANPNMPGAVKAALIERFNPKPPDPYTLSPGQTRYGPGGQVLSSVPATQEPKVVAPGGTVVGPDGKPIYTAPSPNPIKFDDVSGVRKEIQDLPSYKNYSLATPSLNSMIESMDKPSRASDLDFVYAMARIFDPNSVVREGEMVMVNKAQGLPDQLVGTIEALNGGAQLQPETRRALWDVAHGRVQQYKEAYDADLNQYRDLAKRNGINEADIIPNVVPLKEPKPAAPTPPAATTAPSVAPPKIGEVRKGYRYKGGDPAKPDSWEPAS